MSEAFSVLVNIFVLDHITIVLIVFVGIELCLALSGVDIGVEPASVEVAEAGVETMFERRAIEDCCPKLFEASVEKVV